VLAGLSQPLGQFLFEVHAEMSDVAARAFERLAALGTYEYRLCGRANPGCSGLASVRQRSWRTFLPFLTWATCGRGGFT